MSVRDRFCGIRHSAHRDAVSQRGKAFFLKGDRSPRFWITNFLGRHDSAVLKNELEIQSVIFKVTQSQCRRGGAQLASYRGHHSTKALSHFWNSGHSTKTTPHAS